MRSYANKYQVAAGAGAAYDQVQQGVAFGADAPLPSRDGQWLVGLMGGYSRSQYRATRMSFMSVAGMD